MMPGTGILLLLLSLHSPFAVDSTIFAVGTIDRTIREQTVRGPIIDYCIDDFLFVLTKRYLYKLDPDDLHITDRTILPQTYTSMCTNQHRILLLSAGEIVMLAKSNLTYETGIGTQYVDYRPLVSPQGQSIAPDETSLYIIEDEGSASTLKIIDLASGSGHSIHTVPRITTYSCNVNCQTFTTLDIENHLNTYDLTLTKTATTQLPFSINWFLPQTHGYWVSARSAIYLISQQGKIIDFQPLLAHPEQSNEGFMYITPQKMIRIDSLTLRPQMVAPNEYGITQLFNIDHPSLVIGMDNDDRFHFIHTPTMNIYPPITKKILTLEIQPAPPTKRDSLWYLQIGAFANIENALHMYQSLRTRTIPVFIDTGDVYRVKLGGFVDKQLGVYVADKLNINGWFSLQDKIPISEYVHFFVEQKQFILKDGYITRSKP